MASALRAILAAVSAAYLTVAPARPVVVRDLPYGPLSEQRYDLWLPAHPVAAPLVVLVHGGGAFGDKADPITSGFARALSGAGFRVAAINYRLLGWRNPWPQALNDVRTGVLHLARPDAPVVVIAVCIASLMVERIASERQVQPLLAGIVTVAGPHDVVAVPKRWWLAPAMFGNRADLSAISPAHHLQPGWPRTLILHGGADREIPPSQATQMTQRLRSLNCDAQAIILPHVEHCSSQQAFVRVWTPHVLRWLHAQYPHV